MLDPLRSEPRFHRAPKESGARVCFQALKEDLFLPQADAGLLIHHALPFVARALAPEEKIVCK
jgi:hypothetical protein